MSRSSVSVELLLCVSDVVHSDDRGLREEAECPKCKPLTSSSHSSLVPLHHLSLLYGILRAAMYSGRVQLETKKR